MQNTPYKLIINDKNLKVKNTEDLIVKNNNQDNKIVIDNFKNIIKERKIKEKPKKTKKKILINLN